MSELDLEEIPEPFQAFAAIHLDRENRWHELTRMLGTLGPKVPAKEAAKMALLLRERAPRHPFVQDITGTFIRDRFPSWYIDAVNDTWRNAAYRAALKHLADPDKVILEIGTGTGLFAMMAIQAGFRHVYTFESNEHVAKIAAECIRRNGFEDRITLQNITFNDEADITLPERPDVMMHEVSGENLIIPDLFGLIEAARDKGLPEDAPILPHKFAVHAQLSGDPELHARSHVPSGTEGLDLTAINLLAMPRVHLDRGTELKKPMSAPIVAASHDVSISLKLTDETKVIEVDTTEAGIAYGLVHWICQSFPGGAVYENTPGRWCNWYPYYWPFKDPKSVAVGDTVKVEVTTFQGKAYFQDV
ncbi:MAG: hypothetical protein AAF557_25890 [Pseudomonadota bacterium]